MKLKCISLAVGGALAAISGVSNALPLSDYTANTAQYQDVYLSGSSALDPVVIRAGALMCANTGSTIATSTVDYYNYSNEYVITCTLATAVNGKTKLALHKESSNGSVNGTVAVAQQTTRPFISVALLAAQPASTSNCVLQTSSFGGHATVPVIRIDNCANQSTNGPVIANIAPNAGLSDLEPAVFSASAAATLAAANATTVPVVQAFAVPVTIAARNALQTSQGLTAGSDTEANMPSLPKDIINSIYTGNITTWSQIGVTLTDNQIYVARRTDQANTFGSLPNSGTQSSAEVYFTGQLCNGGSQAFVFYGPPTQGSVNTSDCGTASTAPTLGAVSGQSSGGNVAACLTTHNSRSAGAIGVLGAIDQPSTFGANNGFRFVKVGGYSPSMYNVANGLYSDWVESSFNVNPLTGTGANSATVASLVSTFGGLLNNTDALSDVANNITSSFGASVGVMSNAFVVGSAGGAPTYSVPFTSAQILAAPYANFTHEAQGSPDSCQPPVEVFPVNPNPGVNQG